ncbi:hypothetical protein [Arthrobacter sp. EpRS71]|uniref:hypothetical protein n=1 Tax=Arthrobacter sp. EpRS71 TaxID=1743141 RepID=UPI0007833522|nr:hypothetical protein [Arthrobacter sp. EpRS71]
MSRHKKMTRKSKAGLTGLLAAAVIASGAGFIYIAAPWSSSDSAQEIKPVPAADFQPTTEPGTSEPASVVVGESADGVKTMRFGSGAPASVPTEPSTTNTTSSTPEGTFSDTGSSPVRLGPAPMAPAPANDKGAGDFAKIPGTASGSWGVKGQTGGFTYSYPFSLRQAPAGPTPELGISYDSSRVDGLTSATNNQASVVGDGWALSGTGTIRQKFGSCNDQGVTTSYDLCGNKEGQSFSISFGGRSGEIIMDPTQPAEKRFKLQNDDNTKLEYLTGAANGTFDGGYWKITDTSGTQYWFGVNRIPGWSPGKENNSADIVPVYGRPGQPCYSSAGFGSSSCMQAYAWNLDYVVDPNGNSQGYFYKQDTNFYKSQGGSGTLKAYHRASRLERVDYGMRAGTELSTQAPLHVTFGYTGRCTSVDCTYGTDVPDLSKYACTSTSTACAMQSPTFFTDQRLVTVISQALSVNPAGYGDLDYWTFFQSMPDPGDGTKPALWLQQIIHQGTNRTSTAPGTSWITDPPIMFVGDTLQNRVWTVDGLAPLNRGRLMFIKASTGATTTVTYEDQQCTIEDADKDGVGDIVPENNTKRCFPQWWTPTTPIVQDPRQDFFHIYPVKTVVTNAGPGTNGTSDTVTNYIYEGNPAWKYAGPKYVAGTGASQLTWSVLAGWSKVKVSVGNAAPKPTTVTTYLRGLNGTPSNTTGGVHAVSVTASDGTVYTDSQWFAGQEIEKETFVGDGGTRLGTTITAPWASDPTATSTAALGSIQARHIGTAWVKTLQATSTSATPRKNLVTTTNDALGRPISVSDQGEDLVAGDETCVTTTYADNTAANMLSLTATVKTFAGSCSTTGNLLTATRALYDGSTSADPGTTGYVAPTKGNIARNDAATTTSGTAVSVWKLGPTIGYDAHGRPTTSTDNSTGTPRTTTTAYTPAVGLPTTVTVTNTTRNWVKTTTLDSMRGQVLVESDINQNLTSYRYDASGRVTGEWSPLRPQASNPTPGIETSYSISQNAPSWVKVTKLSSDEAPTSTYTLYDGLGRVRQTQKMSPGGGTIATDTWYNSRGDKSKTNNDYYLSPNPDGVLKIPSQAVPSSTTYFYDGAKRPTAVKAMANDNVLLWSTQMSYAGADTTTVTGPGSEAATTTVNNMSGKVLTRKLFHGPTATGTADTSTYSYDALDRLTGMTDTVGNDWSWTFDAAGREISAVDPDSGARSTTYDAAGRQSSTTDAANTVIGYVYDDLDRVLKKTLGTGTAAQTLEAYTYDGNKKGQLSTSKRYNGAALNQVVTTTVTGYNAAYQPATVSVQLPAALDAAAPTYTTTRSYTSTGQIEQESRPANGQMPAENLTYVYNTFDIQTSVFNDNWDTFVGDTQFNHLGQMSQYAQYDNNNTVGGTTNTTGRNQVNFTWDATTGRLTDQWSTNNTRNVASDLGKVEYTYTPSGKIASRELAFSSRPTNPSDYQCYSYDHASRLAAVWTPAPTATTNCSTVPAVDAPSVTGLGGPAAYAQTFKYTPTGDRAEVRRFNNTGALAAKETYTYPAAGAVGAHRVQKIDSAPTGGTASTQNFTWDTTGKMTDRSAQTLTYTPDGRLATSAGASTIPANPNPNAGTGTPPSVTPAVAAVTGERFYDAAGTLVGVKDGTGTTIVIGSVTAHTSTTNVKTATCTYTFAGKTVAQRTATTSGTKLIFVIGDTVNTAQTMTLPTAGAGPITTLTRYTDPLGLTRRANATATANNTYSPATAGTSGVGSNAANPAGFGATNGYISGLDDTASTLTHLGAREMDPVTGIFITPDPILNTEDQRGFTPYTYSFGNVINTSDPSGLKPTCDCDDDRKGTYSYKGNGQYNDGTQVVQEPWYMRQQPQRPWWEQWLSTLAPKVTHKSGGSVQNLGGGLNGTSMFIYVPSAGDDYEGQLQEALRFERDMKYLDDFLTSQPLGPVWKLGSVPAKAAAKEAVKEATEAAAIAAAKASQRMPGVLRVGDVKLPGVPKGATATPVEGNGLQYAIPRGTPEIDPRVTSIRIMDPVTSGKYQHPNGYAVYMNKTGQTVNPLTGDTISNAHPYAHIELPK